MRRLLPFWVMLLITVHGFCQDPVSIRYTVEDGLPSNEVYDAYEDKQGNIWIATDHGVSRFDGYSFRNFTTRDGLSDNTVFEIKEDGRGMVWMRCLNGTLTRMVDGRFVPYAHNDLLKSQVLGGFMADFYLDNAGQMYFTVFKASPRRTFVLDLASGQIRPAVDSLPMPACGLLNVGDSMPRVPLVNLPLATQATGEGFMRCHPQAKLWSIPGLYASQGGIGRTLSVTLDKDTDVGYWGSYLWRIEGCEIKARIDAPMGLTSLERDRHGWVWVLGQGGATILGHNLMTVRELFRKESCLGMLHDSKGRYWICTNNGLLLVSSLNQRLYQHVGSEQMGAVRRLQWADGKLYMLHDANRITAARLMHGALQWDSLSSFTVNAQFLHDFIVHPVGGRPRVMATGRELVEQGVLHMPLEDAGGVSVRQWRRTPHGYLAASNRGFQVFDWDGGRQELASIGREQQFGATAVIEDSSGRIWVGTSVGLMYWEDGKLVQFAPESKLLSERVTDLQVLPDQTLVVATRGNGLVAIRGKVMMHFGEEQGLLSNMCNRLQYGPSGLWVCSNRGLTLVAKDKEGGLRTQNYTMLDGLPSNKVNDVLEIGELVFVATGNGVVSLANGMTKGRLPLTKIEQVKADDRVLDGDFALDADEDNLQFRFQSQKFDAGANLVYSYKLDGYDSEWRTTTENEVNYYKLPPGMYTFRVSAGHPNGPRNPLESRQSVFLPYKLHETLWFQLLLVVVVSGILLGTGWIFYNARQRRLRAEFTRLQAEVKALRSQMRPHFIYNALNSIQQLILMRDHETAQVNLGRFAKLMRAVLDASNHETITIAREIEILQMYLELEKLRFGDDFAYAIELEQGVDWTKVHIPPMLLQPFVENAIWHGLRMKKVDPKLWLRFRRDTDGTICCEVEDNGIGRKAAGLKTKVHKGESVSLSNIQDRIRLINTITPGTLRLEILDLEGEGVALGTLVRLYIAPTYGYAGSAEDGRGRDRLQNVQNG